MVNIRIHYWQLIFKYTFSALQKPKLRPKVEHLNLFLNFLLNSMRKEIVRYFKITILVAYVDDIDNGLYSLKKKTHFNRY